MSAEPDLNRGRPKGGGALAVDWLDIFLSSNSRAMRYSL